MSSFLTLLCRIVVVGYKISEVHASAIFVVYSSPWRWRQHVPL